MNKTKIDWVKNPDGTQGYTWNPITGCLNHTDGLCKDGGFPCYAYRLANGRLKPLYLANKNVAPYSGEIDYMLNRHNPFYPRFWEDRISQPASTKGEDCKGIFVCDMSDLFGIGIPEQWTNHVMNVIKCCQEHRFYLLTKQPQNLIKWSPFPDNCQVGVTVCNDGMMTSALTILAYIEAKVRFISIEPHLGFISMKSHPIKGILDWIIDGAQTKPYKPPQIEWVEEIVRAADTAGVKVFLKDNLGDLPARQPFYRAEDDGGWELRQEMPK